MKEKINAAVERIQKMEHCFDSLLETDDHKETSEALQLLIEYYESVDWINDYELDEKGLLPKDLKRGVLSQDAVYDYLQKNI